MRRLACVLVLVACGDHGNSEPARKDAGAVSHDAEALVAIPPHPLGLPDLVAYNWRKRGGQPAFRIARKAEGKDDWATVVTTCQQALAADPGHLEAAWLLAAGLGKLGKLDEVLPPLQVAAAGDFGKWGQASLELPALQSFLATPTGKAWTERVGSDRATYTAALARSLIVTANGDLYAVDVEGNRWYRLTRTAGAVLGSLAMPSAHQIAYVSWIRQRKGHELGLGVIDLVKGWTSRAVPIGAGPVTIAYSAKPPIGFWIRGPADQSGKTIDSGATWRQLDADYHQHTLPAKTARPPGPWLDVTAKGAVRIHALPADVSADWDDRSLASTMKLGGRIISVATPGLIDGNTASWSPDRAHLAFVAQLDDHCAPGSVNTAAFVADARTAQIKELARAASGIAIAWSSSTKLAIAGDKGVAVYTLDGASTVIDGASGLAIPRERPRCTPVENPATPGEPDDDAPVGDEPDNH
jgi:hypothetical protein